MFPIRDMIPSRRRPVMNWALIGTTVFVFFFLQYGQPPYTQAMMLRVFALVPVNFPRIQVGELFVPYGRSFTFVSYQFLHGGLFHLLVNMWALWIYGDNVEDRMGRGRYLLFYLVSGVVAGMTHFALFPQSPVPTVGASGSISGVMGAYVMMYPRSRILTLVPIFFFPLFLEIPAVIIILIWFAGQVVSGLTVLSAGAEAAVAFWAHLGGFIFGILSHRLFLRR